MSDRVFRKIFILVSVLLRRPEEIQSRVLAARRPPRHHAPLRMAGTQVHPGRSRFILRTGKTIL